jgi:hypothetical protein
LFDRTFKVVEWRNSPGGVGFVYVEYQHLTRLYIPIEVTDLAFVPRIYTTKLTYESILTLTNLGREIESYATKPQTSLATVISQTTKRNINRTTKHMSGDHS